MNNSEKAQVINLLIGDSSNRHKKDQQDIEQLCSMVFPDSSSSSSSSEDFEFKHKQNKPCVNLADIIDDYSPYEFKSNMRLEKSTVDYLIALFSQSKFISNSKTNGGRSRIGCQKTFYMYMWYITNIVNFQELGDLFGVTKSSAWLAVQRVTAWLISIGSNYIKWPKGVAAEESQKLFEQKKGIPGVIGAIGFNHFEIKAPPANKQNYLNKYGGYSLILQAVVDAQMKFIDITCGEPGSLDEIKVLQRSDLYDRVQKNNSELFKNGSFILGDSEYPLTNWLVTPFKDNGCLKDTELRFNHMHSETRMIVQNTFDFLKCRFRRLSSKFTEQTNLMAVTKIIASACILHNICIIRNDTFTENVIQQPDDKENISECELEENEDHTTRIDRRHILFKHLQAHRII